MLPLKILRYVATTEQELTGREKRHFPSDQFHTQEWTLKTSGKIEEHKEKVPNTGEDTKA